MIIAEKYKSFNILMCFIMPKCACRATLVKVVSTYTANKQTNKINNKFNNKYFKASTKDICIDANRDNKKDVLKTSFCDLNPSLVNNFLDLVMQCDLGNRSP